MLTKRPSAVPAANRTIQENDNGMDLGIAAAIVDAVYSNAHRLVAGPTRVGTVFRSRRAGHCSRGPHAAI